MGERERRKHYKQRFRASPAPANADRYLPAAWQHEPKFGLVTRELAAAHMIGDGWLHMAALSAADLHAEMTLSLSDGVDSDIRFAARSLLDLTL